MKRYALRFGQLRGFMALVVLVASISVALSPQMSTAQFDDLAISYEIAVAGVPSPMFMAESPDGTGRLFVVGKNGVVRVSVDGALRAEPFLDITELVNDEFDESGLFSIAFHPEFATNREFFVAFSNNNGTNSVMRFQASEDDPNFADPATGEVVLAIPDDVPKYHNGGGLAFGPNGYLYISTGDDIDEGAPQDLGSLKGKLLRIDPVSGPIPEGEPAYLIPADNPFVEHANARPEIWAYGLRNPWRFSFDRLTGDLFVSDVGQERWEEVNYQAANSAGGQNYGWPVVEGSHCYRPAEDCETAGFTMPVLEYSHDEGCAVIGGYVYRGEASPTLYGSYLFADICTGAIWTLRQDTPGQWDRQLLTEADLTITSFAEDLSGEVFILTFENGAARRIVASNPEPFDSPAFESTWARNDLLVSDGTISRTWIWGPWDTRDMRVERYDEAPNGWRTVVYLDKARMEITYPNADPATGWYVTNGLLVNELVTGRVQLGDDLFEVRTPAMVNVAGDADDANGPTYATFLTVLDRAPLDAGQIVDQHIDRNGDVTTDPSLADQAVMIASVDAVTNHAIAGPFWEFMNAAGPVVVDGAVQDGALFPDPVFASGRPITDPFWADVVVAGTSQLVLIQCFERRCLTYTPNNPDGWQVEAGNVGRHYYDWRYGN